MADLSEANRKEWDQLAKQYDSQDWQKLLSEQLTTFIRKQTDSGWLGVPSATASKECKLLDYACGPGMVTRALQPYITSAVGVDISSGMTEEYNSRMQETGVNAKAVVGNLLAEDATPTVNEFSGFDIAAVGLGFHHFHDSKLMLQRLAERVVPGGVVAIIDWLPSSKKSQSSAGAEAHDHDHHHGSKTSGDEHDPMEPMRHTIAHNGFDEEMMRSLYQEAGMVDFAFEVLEKPLTLVMRGNEVKKTAFLSRGCRPAS